MNPESLLLGPRHRTGGGQMRRILITGAGGAAATNFARSLRLVGETYHLIGTDSDKYCLQRSEVDERYLMPRCDAPTYVPMLNALTESTGTELIFAQPDAEIEVLSERRRQVNGRLVLPAADTVRICMSKYASYNRWKACGLRVPRTLYINNPADLRDCFDQFGPRIWVREVKGAFGKGSLPTDSYEQALAWINFHNGWGRFTGAECLESNSVTWQSIWWHGELIVAQGRRRLYWEFANRTPSGVTGLTGAGVTLSDSAVDRIAQQAILAIDESPHGIFSVDLTYDRDGVPNPTEINIGRFFTTHLFFSTAGLNMPHIFVTLALGGSPDLPSTRINPLPPNLVWIRGMDVEPIMTTVDAIDQVVREFDDRSKRVLN